MSAHAAEPTTLLQELSGGVLAACLTLPLCVGAGILAYSPLGPQYVALGAVAGLHSAIVGGAVAALARRSSFVLTFPTTPICAIQASLTLPLFALCGDWPRFILAMAACLALAGIWQAVFAASGLSRIMRFVPHPVMAGFVSGVAAFIALHQVPALSGLKSLGELARSGFNLPHPALTAFGLGILLLILLLRWVAPKVPGLLVGLTAGTLAYHALRSAFPEVDLGTTIGALPSASFWVLPALEGSTLRSLLAVAGLPSTILLGSLTLALVATLDTFFALRTAQYVGGIQVDPRRDVIGQGAATVAAALAGGLAVSTSISVSMANHHAGGRTRRSTLISAGTLLLGGLLFPGAITILPQVVIAAVLVMVSFRLVDRWIFMVFREAVTARENSRRRRARRDGGVILAVFLATLLGKPVMGVGVGIALACILFILDMSRPVVARRREGLLLRSKRLRSTEEIIALNGLCERIAVLELQGALFFGNAEALAADLEAVDGATTMLILDCRRLREIDTSGLTVLDKAAYLYRKAGRHLLVVGANPAWVERTFTVAGSHPDYVHPSLDAALEWAEDDLLTGFLAERAAQGVTPGTFESAAIILQHIGTRLEGKLPLEKFPAGSFLCRAGEASDRMWILRRGSVRITGSGSASGLLLARLGPGSTVGEMGFMQQAPRSADVQAEEAVTAYVVTWGDLSRMLVEDLETGQAILRAMAGQLSSRLRRTTEELRESESS